MPHVIVIVKIALLVFAVAVNVKDVNAIIAAAIKKGKTMSKKFSIHNWRFRNLYQPAESKESINEAEKENVGNLFIIKDDNGHIHLEIGGRSGQINLGYAGGRQMKEILAKLAKMNKR